MLSLGIFGFAGSPQADACLLSGEVDVLFVVGSSLGELETHCWDTRLQPARALIQVDIEPQQIGMNYPVQLGLVGDARATLCELLRVLRHDRDRNDSSACPDRAPLLTRWKRVPRYLSYTSMVDGSSPLKPQRLIRELQEVMPPDAILFVDIGNVMAWALHYLQVKTPDGFQINLGWASMGHAIAAAIGGKLAAPERPVVALVGDAAFAMNGMEVHTAVENEVAVVWIVMNNGGHGMVCHGERLQFQGKFSTGSFRRPLDICGLARAMGALARRIDRAGELSEALTWAWGTGQPTVIEACVDPNEMPPFGLRIETLDRFFRGEA